MKKTVSMLLALLLLTVSLFAAAEGEAAGVRVLVQGHASLRVTTPEGRIIYIDPYTGEGYDLPADLILITHGHSDHNAQYKVKNRAEGCRIITQKEALAEGIHQTFDLGYVTVEAVEAGNNKNHSLNSCVGYVLTFSNGSTLYVSGDTSATEQMAQLAERHLDAAFFCCDGTYNMGLEEALQCAQLVGARVSIPYHETLLRADAERKGITLPDGILIVQAGEEYIIE